MKFLIKQFIPYLLITVVLTTLFYSTGYSLNWTYWADQELTLGYNGLLINSGLNQEYIDHPGFFSIQLIALLLKMGSLLGLSDVHDITQMNQAPLILDGMRYLVIVARHAALVTTIALLLGIYYVSNKIFQSTVVALLVTFLVFVNNGVFYHFTATRTESIAFLFLLLSIYYFIASYKNNLYKAYLLIPLSLVLFFCGALNKAQIIVLAPFYFCWATFFTPNVTITAAKRAYQPSYFLAGLLSYVMLLYFYSTQSSGIGLLFNTILVSFFNILIIGLALKTGRNTCRSLLIFNTSYLLAYLFAEYFSTLINQGVPIFGNIADPISMTRFLRAVPSQILHPENNFLASTSILERISSALNFAASPLVETFGRISSSTLLILFSLIWVIYQRKIITKREWWLGGFSLFSFYIVNLVNKVRYLDAPQYRLFSEFFLLTFVLALIYRLPDIRAKKRILGLLIFITILANLVPYKHYYNWLIRKGFNPFCGYHMMHAHEKLNVQKILLECAQPSIKL
jgi:hypothetical protein